MTENIGYEKINAIGTVGKMNDEVTFDAMLQTLLTNDKRPGKQIHPSCVDRVPAEKLTYLLSRVNAIFQKEPTLLEIEPPFILFGDIHGQFGDLLDILDSVEWPPKQRLVFLGDYVDRGDQSLEVITLLYILKIRHPQDVYILRGNHETAEINSDYGFKEDCLVHYDIHVWDCFQESFKRLPLAAVIGSKILCMHGGLSPAFHYLDDIKKIPRPLDIPDQGMTCDILWSDPTPASEHQNLCGFSRNRSRNTSVWFCTDIVNDFFKRNDLELIVRGHEVSDKGFEFTVDRKVVTIFSAPYYCEHTNDAAVLSIDSELRCQLRIFKFKKPKPIKQTISIVLTPEGKMPTAPPGDLFNEITIRRPLN